MKLKNLTTLMLAKCAIVTALYVVMSLSIAPISYGIVQFRISEVLNLLAFIDPLYIVSITLGCVITNLFSPFGLPDVIFGSLATLLATTCLYKSKNLIVASLFPTLFCLIVGIEIAVFFGDTFLPVTASIMVSEFIICTLIGVPLFKILFKNRKFLEVLRIDKTNLKVFEKLKISKNSVDSAKPAKTN